MKKNSSVKQSPSKVKRTMQQSAQAGPITIGLDLGDKSTRYCVLSAQGEIAVEGSVATTKDALRRQFGPLGACRIALEVGAHSPWVSRWLSELGHEVIVANPREVHLISQSSRKNDRLDAQMLARLARVDPQLLRPIRHRSEKAHCDLLVIRTRAALVEARTKLVNTARGLVKALGERLPACDADYLRVVQLAGLPEPLQETVRPLVESIEQLTEQIQALDQRIVQIARTQYPETELLQQVSGVGALIALTFVLTVEDAGRFGRSRDVGCYLGLRPKQRASGERQPQLRISKEGDAYLRHLLVQGAHCVLSRRGPDTDLKRWGQRLAERGGKNAKKRATVAVARKLGVLLHRLWVTGAVYEPLRRRRAAECGQAQAA